jgi:phosphate starvation-inducible protein PhoH
MEKVIRLHKDEEAKVLLGRYDENIKLIEREFTLQISARHENVVLKGKEANVILAEKLREEMLHVIRRGGYAKKRILRTRLKRHNL